MKKFLTFLAMVIMVSSCDDGNLTVEDINFDDVALQRCNDNPYLLYKIAGGESIILYLPQESAFVNEATTPGIPRTFAINTTNRVVYRSYNGSVAAGNICDVIPPASPTVAEEWVAQTGNIDITTTVVISENPNLEGGERITGYRHAVVLRNVDFLKPDGTSQFYTTFDMGSFVSTTGVTAFPFAFGDQLWRCGGNRIYNFINAEALTLDIDPALIANEETTPGVPRTGYTGASVNRLSYRIFANAPLTADYFCAEPVPALPNVTEEWIADNGDSANATGLIEVVTTSSGPGVYLHEIRLKNVRFRQGNASFVLATNYLLGYLITS